MDEPQAVPSAVPPPPAIVGDSGLADNVAGAIAYITFIPAILFLILDPYKNRPFVRFNSLQCLGLCVVAFCFSVIMVIPILGWIVGIFGHLALAVFWVICIVKAANGQKFKVPVVGDFVEKMAGGS